MLYSIRPNHENMRCVRLNYTLREDRFMHKKSLLSLAIAASFTLSPLAHAAATKVELATGDEKLSYHNVHGKALQEKLKKYNLNVTFAAHPESCLFWHFGELVIGNARADDTDHAFIIQLTINANFLGKLGVFDGSHCIDIFLSQCHVNDAVFNFQDVVGRAFRRQQGHV